MADIVHRRPEMRKWTLDITENPQMSASHRNNSIMFCQGSDEMSGWGNTRSDKCQHIISARWIENMWPRECHSMWLLFNLSYSDGLRSVASSLNLKLSQTRRKHINTMRHKYITYIFCIEMTILRDIYMQQCLSHETKMAPFTYVWLFNDYCLR